MASSASPLERYEKLGLRELLCRVYDFPLACKDLSFLLRDMYKKAPKNLQNVLFQDTIDAFRSLPQNPTSLGISSANALLHAAEFVLPKQKKVVAVTEFKHAVVVRKRRSKVRYSEEEGSVQLPEDVLVHIFSFLNMRSLASVGLVCRSWNTAARDNILWQSHYAIFFGKSDSSCASKGLFDRNEPGQMNEISCAKGEGGAPFKHLDWREAFKRTYIGHSWKSASNWGYCGYTKSVVWLFNMKCTCAHHNNSVDDVPPWKFKPISLPQVSNYILGEPLLDMLSSDSDSDSDETLSAGWQARRLWAYSRRQL